MEFQENIDNQNTENIFITQVYKLWSSSDEKKNFFAYKSVFQKSIDLFQVWLTYIIDEQAKISF